MLLIPSHECVSRNINVPLDDAALDAQFAKLKSAIKLCKNNRKCEQKGLKTDVPIGTFLTEDFFTIFMI